MARTLLIDEVAKRIRISKNRAYELARRGVLPHFRVGRSVRVDEEALEQWLANGGSLEHETS